LSAVRLFTLISILTTTTIGTVPAATASIETVGQRFEDNGDGTVTDIRTGLVWLKNANPFGRKPWGVAGVFCRMLRSGMAGLTDGSVSGDWRLPSKEELQGIGTDPPATWEGGEPSVTWTKPGAPFINVEPDRLLGDTRYWTSTIYRGEPPYDGWPISIRLFYGDTDAYLRLNFFFAWPVRNGK
jgi:hypothetical protein